MKVCLIAELAALHTRRWAEGLAKAGCEVYVISNSVYDINNVHVCQIQIYSPNPIKQFLLHRKVKKIINDIKPDICHLFGLFSFASLGTMRLAGCLNPLVVSVWGTDIVPAVSGSETIRQKFVKKYLLARADAIFASSEYLAKETEKYVRNRNKIEVLYWGVDLEDFNFLKQEDNETVTIGFAKRLHSLSGIDVLLKAFSFAQDKSSKTMCLKIAGDGVMRSKLEILGKSLGISDSIEWLGWIDDTRDFYKFIDIFVMPSRRESLGVAAIEAAASGIPIIGSRFGGIPEVVKNGENGLLTAPEDIEMLAEAILTLVENFALRQKMGRKGRLMAEKYFDWEKTISSMIKVYDELSVE